MEEGGIDFALKRSYHVRTHNYNNYHFLLTFRDVQSNVFFSNSDTSEYSFFCCVHERERGLLKQDEQFLSCLCPSGITSWSGNEGKRKCM